MTDFKFDLQEKSISKIFDFLDESKKILILSTRPKTYQDKLKNKIYNRNKKLISKKI